VQIVRALVVDDDTRFRQCVKRLLLSQPGIEVAGEAADGHEAILQAQSLAPDLILMDIRMGGMDGIKATRQLKDKMPGVKIVLVSLYDLEEYRDAASRSGADAYVIKREMVDSLVPVIRNVVGQLATEKGTGRGERGDGS